MSYICVFLYNIENSSFTRTSVVLLQGNFLNDIFYKENPCKFYKKNLQCIISIYFNNTNHISTYR